MNEREILAIAYIAGAIGASAALGEPVDYEDGVDVYVGTTNVRQFILEAVAGADWAFFKARDNQDK